MKFRLTTSGSTYPDGRRKKQLEKLGFKFTQHDQKYTELYQGIWGNQKDMYHMDWNQEVTVEINTLEDLLAFQKKFGQIVLSDNEIEIYDDYRE